MHFIEQPPRFFRAWFPHSTWRLPSQGETPCVYLTFDDGPIPEVTPWVLHVLDEYQIKATFFMVGDNVRKHPDTFNLVKQKGHSIGNHSFNHIQGLRSSKASYLSNIDQADKLIHSPLYRPPHGLMRRSQRKALLKHYNLIMYDVVTRDYDPNRTPQQAYNTVKRFVRNGSILVFHDSLKAYKNIKGALRPSIEWLIKQNYQFRTIVPFNITPYNKPVSHDLISPSSLHKG